MRNNTKQQRWESLYERIINDRIKKKININEHKGEGKEGSNREHYDTQGNTKAKKHHKHNIPEYNKGL